MSVVDVLIIGAGPTGLMMAAELRRHGLSCRIIDKSLIATTKSKAIVVQSRTLEIFNHLGIVKPFLDQGIQVVAANPISQKKPLAHIETKFMQSDFPFILSIEQAKTEKILESHLNQLGTFVERGFECLSFDVQEDCVNVLLHSITEEKQELIKASWLIGCDGAHSLVRKSLGFNFEGRAFCDVFSLADVEIHWDKPHNEFFAYLDAKGVMACIPLPEKRRYRVVCQLPRCRGFVQKELPHGQIAPGILAEPTISEIEEMLKTYTDTPIYLDNSTWMANFHINSRMAKQYQKGRIFLAGDAAHIHSPIGGQGMNTGIQDAFNLAWKIACCHKGQLCKKTLGTYEIERRHIGKQLLKATEKASSIVMIRNPFFLMIRNVLFKCLMNIDGMQRSAMNTIGQLKLCYPKNALVQKRGFFSKGPKVGTRLVNFPLLHQKKKTSLSAYLQKSTKWHLLVFCKESEVDLFQANFSKEFVEPLFILSEKTEKDGAFFYDEDHMAHKCYGASKGSCLYLIRPDLYIGYKQSSLCAKKLLNFFKSL